MANFYKSNDVDIDFSEEEKEILKKASEILNDLGGGIENALEGDYRMP